MYNIQNLPHLSYQNQQNMRNSYSEKQIEIVTEFRVLLRLWKSIAKEFEITNSRQRRNVRFRHATMTAMRTHGGLSLNDVGKIFEKDHATVLHAMKLHEMNYRYDREYKAVYMDVEKMVKDTLDEYELRDFTLPELSSIEMNYHSVVKVYRGHITELESKNLKLKTQLEEATNKLNAIYKQYNTIVNRNDELNQLVKRYKNLAV